MKKIITAAVTVLAAASMALTASAAKPVGKVTTPEVSGITVDGKISAGEYDGAAKITLDGKNLKAGIIGETIAEGFSADVYFGWDANYLYVAYDVTDGTKCYFTEYTWNGGDNIQLLLDVGKKLNGRENILDMNKGTLNGARRGILMSSAPQLKADGTPGAALYLHQCVENESVIQDPVNYPYAASLTDKGWQFEEAIPWALLLQDMKDKTGEDIPAPAKGSIVTALFIYNDYNANRELAGLYGSMADMNSFDWAPEQHGIELVLAGKKGEEPTPPETGDGIIAVTAVLLATAAAAVVLRRRTGDE